MDRGKGLGGSSATNFMVSIYPSRASIDFWQKLGNQGWSYDHLSPYLIKFATRHAPSEKARQSVQVQAEDGKLNGHGPIQLSYADAADPWNSAWVKGHAALGFDQLGGDPAGVHSTGPFLGTVSIDPQTKTRSYAAKGYYGNEVRQRDNLVVLTDTLVSKIELEGQDPEIVATGVQLQLKDGSKKSVRARREVILAAGAIQSPQILELSGVGRRDLLEKHGIPILIDNANVGENLQDHPQTPISYELKDGLPSIDLFRDHQLAKAAMEQYMLNGEGPLGSPSFNVSYLPVVDADGLVATEAKKKLLDKHADDATPQGLVLKEMLSQPNEPAVALMWFPCQMNVDPQGSEHFGKYNATEKPENYVTLLTALAHPFSRGTCHIQSSDVRTAPAIDPRYYTHPADMEIAARAIMFGEKLTSKGPLHSATLKPGGARMPGTVGDSLENAAEIVRTRTVSNMHMCGTCGMMPRDKGGVVDSRLIVHGTRNLRIVDASIFPLVPLGNIQPIVYAVAERAADLIRAA